MLTIKLFLAESGSVATIDKDFPLYQGQFQNILLNVFVPLSTLAPDFALSTDSGQYDGINTPYVAGATVTVACRTVKRNGAIATSKAYNLRFVKNISKNGVGYALFERKLPKAFTNYAGVAPAGLTMICNVTNISYGQIDQSATTATSAKGAVTINFPVLTQRIPAVSADYTFDYDTAETPASWYLNGRKVSLADYGLSIAWTPKNQDTISLSVVAENPTTTSVLTTQTVKYDVFPSSDLDADEPADPTATEVLQAQVNSITSKIVEMGDELDKKQNKSDDALKTTSKDVVPAINELKGSIGSLDNRVTKNEENIANLSKEISTGITYVGTMSYEGNEPPTDEQLNAFVEGQPGASLAGGDLVIAVQEIPDATDVIYACIYSSVSETWSIAPIPGLELASDNNAGLIQGGNSGDGKLYVKIVNGVIQDITANAVSGYPAVSVSNLGRMYTDIQSIKNGETSVGLALKAVKDAKGNTIDSYYMPNSIGATRNFVRQYALPVEFNDALYVSANGLVKEVPTTPASGEQFVVNSSSTGYTTLFTVAYNLNNDGGTKFQLSKKNSYNADLFVKAAAPEEVQFVVDLTAGADPNGEGNTTLSTHVTLDTPVTTSLTDISISSLLNELEDNIITLDGSKGNVYIVAKVSVFRTSSAAQTFTVVCNDMYRSAFHLSTAFQTVAINTGKVGELPQMIFTEYAVEGNNVVFTPSMVVPPDNSVVHVVLPYVPNGDQGKTVLLDIGGESVNINTPNGANALVSDLLNSTRNTSGYDFLMTYTGGTYYVQQGYETSVASVQFPSGDRTVTYGTDDGLSISATGNVNYGVKTENPQMTVSVPLKAGAGITMDADANGKFLEIKNADHDAVANKLDKVTTSTTYIQVYGKSASGNQTMINATSDTAGLIILRDDNKCASVGTPTKNTHITNKAYVDEADAKKLDKKTAAAGTEKLYGVSGTSQEMYTADSENANASTIVKRRADGSILAKATTATDKSGFIYKKSVVNNETLDTALSSKQDTLVSGTNIKTVNGQNILGSGNIDAGGTDVEGNPSGNATDGDLSKIKIGSKIYNIHNYTDAINAKLDIQTTATGTVKLYGVNGTSQSMYTVAAGNTEASTVVMRNTDGSILAKATTETDTTKDSYKLAVVNNKHLDTELEKKLDIQTAGTAKAKLYGVLESTQRMYIVQTDAGGSTVVMRDTDGSMKAAKKSATSANAEYVATISNIVDTNHAITDVRGRVTALEQKHLYLHCITLSKDAGSDDPGYGVSFNIMSAKSSAYASYSALATAIGANFKTSASGILYSNGSDKQPLHIASAQTASATTVIFEGCYVTTDGGGGGSVILAETSDVPFATFTDTVSTIY